MRTDVRLYHYFARFVWTAAPSVYCRNCALHTRWSDDDELSSLSSGISVRMAYSLVWTSLCWFPLMLFTNRRFAVLWFILGMGHLHELSMYRRGTLISL